MYISCLSNDAHPSALQAASPLPRNTLAYDVVARDVTSGVVSGAGTLERMMRSAPIVFNAADLVCVRRVYRLFGVLASLFGVFSPMNDRDGRYIESSSNFSSSHPRPSMLEIDSSNRIARQAQTRRLVHRHCIADFQRV